MRKMIMPEQDNMGYGAKFSKRLSHFFKREIFNAYVDKIR